ncbi:hypothetical protein CC2G_008389 [Coprinopsis cinerea AmutBmut pab1-1]|nr:hypothetical protein CC2G_008389 [Coprinopsis cinerea AmutBmut pab1-1]KAG2015088.1 hypothetical protein CC2G_008389 [Coprinopsis cinerea AmutBmut pab1-1]
MISSRTVLSIVIAALCAGKAAHGIPVPQVLPGGGLMCGGLGWTGPAQCTEGYECVWLNQYASLCLPKEYAATRTTTDAPNTRRDVPTGLPPPHIPYPPPLPVPTGFPPPSFPYPTPPTP